LTIGKCAEESEKVVQQCNLVNLVHLQDFEMNDGLSPMEVDEGKAQE
jgi:hypothetical protein